MNSNNWKNPLLSWFGLVESQEFVELTKPKLETCAFLHTSNTLHTCNYPHQHDSDERNQIFVPQPLSIIKKPICETKQT
jgi:hypothetical protein